MEKFNNFGNDKIIILYPLNGIFDDAFEYSISFSLFLILNFKSRWNIICNEEMKCGRLWKENELFLRFIFLIRNNPKRSFDCFSLEIHVWFKCGKFYKVGGSLNRY